MQNLCTIKHTNNNNNFFNNYQDKWLTTDIQYSQIEFDRRVCDRVSMKHL